MNITWDALHWIVNNKDKKPELVELIRLIGMYGELRENVGYYNNSEHADSAKATQIFLQLTQRLEEIEEFK